MSVNSIPPDFPPSTVPHDRLPALIVRPSVADRLSNRKWPAVLTAVTLLTGILFMLEWDPVSHHINSWAIGGDVWGIYRGAHYIGWGSVGQIYSSGTGIVAFPGMAVLLSPVALITWHLHMSESFGPFVLTHPTAALVLEPVELLLSSTVIVASDALAERMGVFPRRRFWLCVVVAMVAWPTSALWGHAEDSFAVTFAMYAMSAMLDKKWARMGWLFGLGILMQPLVALMLPLFIGFTPQGQRLLLAVRALVLSAALVTVSFLGDAADTYRQLVQQPTPPSLNHATPWAALAPQLTSGALATTHGATFVGGVGHAALKAVTVTAAQSMEVSGGPGRMIDVVLAVLLGFAVWWRPQAPILVLWLAAVVLASRCFFESVMTPYYLAPPLFLCLVLASRQPRKRFWPVVAISLAVTVFAYQRMNPWLWWAPLVVGLVAILALVLPNDQASVEGVSNRYDLLDLAVVAQNPIDSGLTAVDRRAPEPVLD
jgi:hypothetical protein